MKLAVKAGTELAILDSSELNHIDLKSTGSKVLVDGVVYELRRGTTYLDSSKIDEILNTKKVFKVSDCKNDYINNFILKK